MANHLCGAGESMSMAPSWYSRVPTIQDRTTAILPLARFSFSARTATTLNRAISKVLNIASCSLHRSTRAARTMGFASASVTTTSLLALALAALAFVSRAAAQGNGCSSVMMTLAPCMDFISSKASEPGISCCSVLAGVVQTDPRCLCMVLDGTATSFGIAINQTRALELPGVWSQASLRHLHRRLPTSQQQQRRRKKPTQLQMPLQVLSSQMLHMPPGNGVLFDAANGASSSTNSKNAASLLLLICALLYAF